MEPEPASGTLIFLFTDLEGSTRLWEQFPQAMKAALERHDSILQAAVAASNGQVVKTTGDGMMAVFTSAAAAAKTCLVAQRDLDSHRLKDLGRPERSGIVQDLDGPEAEHGAQYRSRAVDAARESTVHQPEPELVGVELARVLQVGLQGSHAETDRLFSKSLLRPPP